MSWRERFREDNELLLRIFGPLQRKLYLWIAVYTFIYQIPARWELCGGIVPCSVSFAKGTVWGMLWPIFWLNRFGGDPIGLILRTF